MNLEKTLSFFIAPFAKEKKLFSIIIAISLLYYLSILIIGIKSISVLLAIISLAYTTTLLLSVFPTKIKNVISWGVVSYMGIIAILSYCGSLFLRNNQPLYTLSIILQTNIKETEEFFSAYLNTKTTILLLFGCIIVILAYKLSIKILRAFQNKMKVIFATICILCSAIYIQWPEAIVCTPPFCIFQPHQISNFSFVNLNSYKTTPALSLKNRDKLKTIILIVGESLSKSHCSLYGYNKETNPNLLVLKNEGALNAFTNITASQVGTGAAFKDIMSTYSSRDRDNYWASCQTLPTIMETAGYETYWISNQSCMGLFDAIPNKYAKLCKHVSFTSHEINLDEKLVDMVASNIDTSINQFFVINLMGNHEDFASRYSDSFSYFKACDYKDLPEWQRQTVAEYDNSVLYNDYVVSSIMKLFADKDAIVIYFPDHALDIYESDENYVGHAQSTERSLYFGKQIPFMVYTPQLFQEKHSTIVNRLNDKKEKKFCTEDVLYFIMDIAGYKFKDNNEVEKYSLLSD